MQRNGGILDHNTMATFAEQLLADTKTTFRQTFGLSLGAFKHPTAPNPPTQPVSSREAPEAPEMPETAVRRHRSARSPQGRNRGSHRIRKPSGEQRGSQPQSRGPRRPAPNQARDDLRTVSISPFTPSLYPPNSLQTSQQQRSVSQMAHSFSTPMVANEQQVWSMRAPSSNPIAIATPVQHSNLHPGVAPLLLHHPETNHLVSTPHNGPSSAGGYPTSQPSPLSPFHQHGSFPSPGFGTSQPGQQTSPPFAPHLGSSYGQQGFTQDPWPQP